MGAVAEPVSEVVNTVSNVFTGPAGALPLVGGGGGGGLFDGIGDAFSSLADTATSIVEQVAAPVVKAVENTVQSAVNDPIGTMAKVAAVATGNPELLPLISGADVIANGGSIDQALTAGATSYVAGQVGGEVGGNVAQQTDSAIAGNVAGGAAGAATGAVLGGKDPITAAISGGVNSGVNAGIKDAATTDYLNSVENGQGYYTAPSPTEQDVLAADPTIPLPPQSTDTTPAVDTIPPTTSNGYIDETTGQFISDPNGGLQAPLTNDTSGTNTDSMSGYTYDPNTQTWTSPDGTVTDLSQLSNSQTPTDFTTPTAPDAETIDPLTNLPKVSLNLFGTTGGTMANAGNATGGPSATNATAPTFDPITMMPVGKTSQTTQPGTLNPLLFSLAGFPLTKQTASAKDAFGDLALGTSKFAPTPVAQQQQQEEPQSFAQGGLASMHPAGEPAFYSEGGLENRYIKGDGDGTSDSIPAMVADSEFVMPADVVAALGNGSSDAGAHKLDIMVQQIRKRARSTAPSELPPTAHESPLDYLKGRA